MTSRIIDFRLRPPLRSYLDTAIWSPAGVERFNALQGVVPAPSARARSMDLMLQEMDAAGIAIGVMNGRQCTDFRGEVTNRDLAGICNAYPGRFLALSGANPFKGPGNVAEARSFILDEGFKGIAIDPAGYEQFLEIDDERLFPYYEVCMATDSPAVFTIGPMGGSGIHFANALQVDRLAARFPELKLVVSLGCWPYVAELCGVAARRPNVYLMPDMYHVGMPGQEMFTAAASSVARGRFVFASAYPSRPLGLAVESYQALGWSQQCLDEVMHGTAARLLKLA